VFEVLEEEHLRWQGLRIKREEIAWIEKVTKPRKFSQRILNP
jgi:hypothetical protein